MIGEGRRDALVSHCEFMNIKIGSGIQPLRTNPFLELHELSKTVVNNTSINRLINQFPGVGLAILISVSEKTRSYNFVISPLIKVHDLSVTIS